MDKNTKYLISLAGFFHDIGKFYQRATHIKTSENQKKEFGYAHAYLSYRAINEELIEGFKAVFSKDEIDKILDGVYHHKPNSEIQYLIQKADWISSSERAKEETIYNVDVLPEDQKKQLVEFAEQNPRLRSIFENLKLNKEVIKSNYFYKISPLNLSKDIFPKSLEEAFIDLNEKTKNEILGDYKEHWQKFKNEFNEKLKNVNLKFSEHPEKIFSLIYHLLYKYLWCIPASTFDKENYTKHYPDISLFDHSRILSAVATVFADSNKDFNKNWEKTKKEKLFLHLKGDISGIQKFIYKVHQGQGGVAKRLRGRSFYIALLPEVLSRYILNQLGYPITNLLYSGGGIFEILIANTEENKEKLKEIEIKINQFLAENFEADLGLAIGKYEYSPEELETNYQKVLERLNENLDNAKKQRFNYLLETGKIFEVLNYKSNQIKENKKKCPSCNTYLIGESKEVCDLCEKFKNIGQILPNTKYLIFSIKKENSKNERAISFDEFGTVYLIENKEDLINFSKDKNVVEILKINDTSLNRYSTGFKFMGKVVPKATTKILPEETGEEEIIYKDQIVSFTLLAEYSEGDSRIGILRMDVDNLGKLFSFGLKGKISISRIATISRMLDLFFAGYLNNICESLTGKVKAKEKDKNFKIDNLFYILYSGGDDVFLIAPWDKAIEVAKLINDKFKEFTCYNPNITISAGYIQVKPKFPIKTAAEIAGESEDIAKEKGKNRISVLGDVITWDELEEIKEQADKLEELIEKQELQRGFIYAVHRLKEQFLKDETQEDKLVFPYKEKPNPMFYPYAQYYIARNIKGDFKEKIAKMLFEEKIMKKLTFLTNYVSLKTRSQKS